MLKLVKMGPVRAEFFHADVKGIQTAGRRDVTKQTVAFSNIANAHKN